MAVGPRASVSVPAGAYVVDVKGKTLIPGLVDVHWHGPFGADGIIPQQNWVHLRHPGLRRDHAARPVERHATRSSPPPSCQRAGHDHRAAHLLDRHHPLRRQRAVHRRPSTAWRTPARTCGGMKAVGAFSVKSYNQPRRDQRQQVIAAARELGMMVVPEGGSLFEHNMTHGGGRPHRRRALAPGGAASTTTCASSGRAPRWATRRR